MNHRGYQPKALPGETPQSTLPPPPAPLAPMWDDIKAQVLGKHTEDVQVDIHGRLVTRSQAEEILGELEATVAIPADEDYRIPLVHRRYVRSSVIILDRHYTVEGAIALAIDLRLRLRGK